MNKVGIFVYSQYEETTMILIADSGSTKTDWALLDEDNTIKLSTQGINPFFQKKEDIESIIAKELLGALPTSFNIHDINAVFFYGAGCTKEMSPIVKSVLQSQLRDATQVKVDSDMLGAAHALCGKEEGIACILGTGMNTCLYNGSEIVKNVPPLGYILGDEGSGAMLGKMFINALLKGRLSTELKNDFKSTYHLSQADIIEKVYRQPMANRFLASFSSFIESHLDDKAIIEMVVTNFRSFFSNNIHPYERHDLKVNAIGSVAFFFIDQFKEAAEMEGFDVGNVVKSPMEGMIAYHSDKH